MPVKTAWCGYRDRASRTDDLDRKEQLENETTSTILRATNAAAKLDKTASSAAKGLDAEEPTSNKNKPRSKK
jgi:hypothetical protein